MLSLSGFRKWFSTDSPKEIYKLIFIFMLGIPGTIIAWIMKILILEPLPKDSHEWWILVKNLPKSIWEGLLDSPVWFSLVASLCLMLAAVLGFALRFAKRISSQEALLTSAATYRALVEQIGIHSHWPNAIPGGAGAPWSELCADILSNGNKNLSILGANGIETFGASGAPLHEALLKYHGTLRVVLSDPDSPQTRARARAVNKEPNTYKKSIKSSIRFIRELRTQSRHFYARYYDGKPNWKLIITDNRAWVQYYTPGGPDVANTPVYVLKKTESEFNLYNLFHHEFERIWERCANKKIVE